jgi:GntR family transcriptional regulator
MYPLAASSDAYGPLYSRIAMLMRQRILGGRWTPQSQIPTIEGLMAEFGASRVTIRLALDMLERERLLETVDDVLPPGKEGLNGRLAKSYSRLKRVHMRDNVAFAVMHIYVDRRWYRQAADRFNHELVIPVLQSLDGLKIGHAHQSLSIGCAEPDVAAHLGVPVGAPVGMLRRVICDEENVAVYVGDFTYRGDMVRMEVDLVPPDGDGK